MIIFVGDKPSRKNIDPNIAFVGTKSYKRLLEWIWEMDININNVQMCNKKDFKEYSFGGQYYIDPCDGMYLDILIHDKIIVLGNEAEKTIKKIGLNYFKLPHPSGSNRKLNDKKYVKQILKECKEWLNES